MSADEVWRPVSRRGEVWPYEVSSLGQVRRAGSGRPLAQLAHSKGYLRVNLYRQGKVWQEYVHTLVCVAFHGPRPPGKQVDHRDTDRMNNAASNLRWLTAVDNGTRYHQWYADRTGEVHEEWTQADEAIHAKTIYRWTR